MEPRATGKSEFSHVKKAPHFGQPKRMRKVLRKRQRPIRPMPFVHRMGNVARGA
jgi:hypothetical protein